MDRIKELFHKLIDLFKRGLAAVENSSLFEKIVKWYHDQPKKSRSLLLNLLRILCMAVLVMVIAWPIYSMISKRLKMGSYESVLSEAKTLEILKNSKAPEYAPPAGWKSFSANSAAMLQLSLVDFMKSIGVTEEMGTVNARGNDIHINVLEANIRQVKNMTHQLESLAPGVEFTHYLVQPQKADEKLLSFEATLRFNPELAPKIALAGGASSSGRKQSSSFTGSSSSGRTLREKAPPPSAPSTSQPRSAPEKVRTQPPPPSFDPPAQGEFQEPGFRGNGDPAYDIPDDFIPPDLDGDVMPIDGYDGEGIPEEFLEGENFVPEPPDFNNE